MLAEGWTVSLDEIGCRQDPAELQESVVKISVKEEE